MLSGILSDGCDAEFRELFDIIDTDKEGFVDWDKFCSHMQRDYQEKDDRLKTTQVCCGAIWTMYYTIIVCGLQTVQYVLPWSHVGSGEH